MEYSKPEAKLWARKNMKGLEVPIFPSFTPDLEQLDEEGIRLDVNHIFANGFTSVMAAPEVCAAYFAAEGSSNAYTPQASRSRADRDAVRRTPPIS